MAYYLIDKFSSEKNETDLIFHLLTIVHDEYYENALHQSDLHYPSFVYEVMTIFFRYREILNYTCRVKISQVKSYFTGENDALIGEIYAIDLEKVILN